MLDPCEMDGLMEQCELPLFDPSSIANDDLGLTLSPGSQSQLSGSWFHGQDALDLGIDLDFDPFTDFDRLVHQLDGSNKRTNDEAFEEEADHQMRKKQNLEAPGHSPAVEKVLELTSLKEASISSHAAPAGSSAQPASSAAKNRFSIEQKEAAHRMAFETTIHNKPDPKHVSPYGPVGYHPSAPNLHLRGLRVEMSNEALQNRLQNSRRRIDVLTAERNRYRDALLKYTIVDPKTGKLGIHLQEAELATLRRVCSTQQQRAKQFKADIEEWKVKYVNLAQTHNSLIRDYQQPFTASPAEGPITSQEDWKVKYHQLGQVYNDLLAAYIHSRPPVDTNTSYPSYPSPSSPRSASPPTHLSTASSTAPPTDLSDRLLTPLFTNLSAAGPATMLATSTPIHLGQVPMVLNTATANLAPSAHSPTASPKEVEVIDLTTDDDQGAEKVSTHGSPAAAQETSPLTNFHREFRKKELRWLHTITPSDRDAATHLFQKFNPRYREGRAKVGLGRCYEIVDTQKHVRYCLGGPFAATSTTTTTITTTTITTTAAVVSTDDKPYDPSDDDLVRMMEEELDRPL